MSCAGRVLASICRGVSLAPVFSQRLWSASLENVGVGGTPLFIGRRASGWRGGWSMTPGTAERRQSRATQVAPRSVSLFPPFRHNILARVTQSSSRASWRSVSAFGLGAEGMRFVSHNSRRIVSYPNFTYVYTTVGNANGKDDNK